jgi:putative salt-induced outer membrane protein YdiY
MRARTLIGACVLALAIRPSLGLAQHTVWLRRGDQVTGRLKEIAERRWIVAYLGVDLAIPIDSITTLRVPPPAVGLRLVDGTIVAATVEPAGDSLALVLADGTVRRVPPAALAAIGSADNLRALRPRRYGILSPLLTRWGFTGSLGFSDKRGNSRAQAVTAGFQLQRRAPRDRVDIGATAISEQSETPSGGLRTTVAKGSQYLQVDLSVSSRVFLTAGTRQEQDRFQDIELRSTYSAGVGVRVVAVEHTDLRANVTTGLRREAYVSGGVARTAVAGVAVSLRRDFGWTVVDVRAGWDPRMADLRDYRFSTTGSMTARLYKGFGLRLAILEEYNSRPRPGVKPNDLLTTTTLTYTVGR